MGKVSPIKDTAWAIPLLRLQSLAITVFGGDISHHSLLALLALLACPFMPH